MIHGCTIAGHFCHRLFLVKDCRCRWQSHSGERNLNRNLYTSNNIPLKAPKNLRTRLRRSPRVYHNQNKFNNHDICRCRVSGASVNLSAWVSFGSANVVRDDNSVWRCSPDHILMIYLKKTLWSPGIWSGHLLLIAGPVIIGFKIAHLDNI